VNQITLSQVKQLILNKSFIIGLDEVGTGAVAGPAFVCGVKAPIDWNLLGINDSKKLTEKKRDLFKQQLFNLSNNKEIFFSLAEITVDQIDQQGLASAVKNAYQQVFSNLCSPDCLIICDGKIKFDNTCLQTYHPYNLIKADTLIPHVSAASIIAKTHRDALMRDLAKQYPNYDFETNVGYYGAANIHLNAIKKFGLSPIHRRSYHIKALEGIILPEFKP